MAHTRWNIVVISFALGLMVGIFLTYSFSGSVRWHASDFQVVRDHSSPQGPPMSVQKKRIMPVSSPSSPSPLKMYAKSLSGSSYTEVENAYYRRLEDVHIKCSHMPHIGRRDDGGWEVCMSPAFKPKRPCLVYSFGVNDVWEFDEAMARDFGCTVRAFDPSMNKPDHVHQPGPVNFYRLGLGGSDRRMSNGWQLYQFKTYLQKFGESDRIIDLVKIDIEYSEWDSFESMLLAGNFVKVKQLLFETHTNDLNGVITSKEVYLRYHKILDGIEALGFRRFHRHDNPYGVGPVSNSRSRTGDPVFKYSAKVRRTCCHELYYVNMNFAKNMTGLQLVR